MFGQGLNFGGLTGSAPFDADYLVVAGGASGGGYYYSGAGGAGGLRTSYTGSPNAGSGGGQTSETILSLSLSTPYNVTIGAGGASRTTRDATGANGVNSIFSTITSTGGGGGGTETTGTLSTGGSGGGATGGGSSGGAGGLAVTSPATQGFAGGGGVQTGSGGGGGAGSVGGGGASGASGNGGLGLEVNIIGGTGNFYAGGGGGGGGNPSNSNVGLGGSGIGGNGATYEPSGTSRQATAGVTNTGSGGGGGSHNGTNTGSSGAGGSGTVILRYPTAKVSSYAVTGTLDTTANTAYPIANKAYYKLNGNANDSSGNGYNGTASNVTYAGGRFGQTGVFNGSNSKIEISGLNSFLASSSSKSWSCWVKTTSTGNIGNRAIISDYGNGVGNYNFDCFLTPVDGKVLLYSSAGGSSVGMTSLVTINDGVWHHICAVQDTATTNLKLYIDSNLQGSITIGTGTRLSSLFIGTYGAGYYWDGEIDQVRIFSSALSAGNVTSLYNESTVVESTDGTDSILQFIGGSGDITFS